MLCVLLNDHWRLWQWARWPVTSLLRRPWDGQRWQMAPLNATWRVFIACSFASSAPKLQALPHSLSTNTSQQGWQAHTFTHSSCDFRFPSLHQGTNPQNGLSVRLSEWLQSVGLLQPTPRMNSISQTPRINPQNGWYQCNSWNQLPEWTQSVRHLESPQWMQSLGLMEPTPRMNSISQTPRTNPENGWNQWDPVHPPPQQAQSIRPPEWMQSVWPGHPTPRMDIISRAQIHQSQVMHSIRQTTRMDIISGTQSTNPKLWTQSVRLPERIQPVGPNHPTSEWTQSVRPNCHQL